MVTSSEGQSGALSYHLAQQGRGALLCSLPKTTTGLILVATLHWTSRQVVLQSLSQRNWPCGLHRLSLEGGIGHSGHDVR